MVCPHTTHGNRGIALGTCNYMRLESKWERIVEVDDIVANTSSARAHLFKICLSALSKQKCAFRFQSPIVFTSLSDIGSSTPPQNYCEDCSCQAMAMGAVSTVCWVAINMINCNNFDSKLPSCASMHKAQITCTGFLLVCDHCYTTCMFVIMSLKGLTGH